MSKNKIYLFIFIVLLGFFLRIVNINWDQGFHLHPDERAIVIYTLPLNFPSSISGLFSPLSSWNPHFFAYGSFPMYLLKITGSLASNFDPIFASYQDINLVGRFISALADIGTLVIIFLISKRIFNQSIALIAILLYALSVLPIQLSHFYAVDTILTFFIISTLYRLIIFYDNPSIKNSIKAGVIFGFALATKISALVLLTSVGTAVAIDFILLVLRKPLPKHWFVHLPPFLKKFIKEIFLIGLVSAIVFVMLEPYAIIDFNNFLSQTLIQNRMTENAFTFPYTLQYVGKTPYLYDLKNIFLFGLGPAIAITAFIGTTLVTFTSIKNLKKLADQRIFILLSFFWVYLAIVGKFAIGFMRYMLPLYPLLCMFAAALIFRISAIMNKKIHKELAIICYLLFALLLLFWPLSFTHIYSRPNTRVLASLWINENIPTGSTIAIEHWDDSLPLFGQNRYVTQTFELYNPDSKAKWDKINQQLSTTQYIIIASNRLYVPLQKLTDCSKLPPLYCYPITFNYYKDLFSGRLGFRKVAEFSVQPQLSFLGHSFITDDFSADESFTVYDHPRVIIFKRI